MSIGDLWFALLIDGLSEKSSSSYLLALVGSSESRGVPGTKVCDTSGTHPAWEKWEMKI
jgi:hypothetical protein